LLPFCILSLDGEDGFETFPKDSDFFFGVVVIFQENDILEDFPVDFVEDPKAPWIDLRGFKSFDPLGERVVSDTRTGEGGCVFRRG
jgi:hypothetical protein